MTNPFVAVATALLLATTPTVAAPAPTDAPKADTRQCMPHPDFVTKIMETGGEIVFIGQTMAGVLEVWTNGGLWVIVSVGPDGFACINASGDKMKTRAFACLNEKACKRA